MPSKRKEEKLAKKQAEQEELKRQQEEERERVITARTEKAGLNIYENEETVAAIRKLAASKHFQDIGETASLFANNDIVLLKSIMSYEKTISDQNYIIIRQLDRIEKLLEKE